MAERAGALPLGRDPLFIDDLTGDGRADLAVGAFGNDAGGQNAGRVYVVSGTQLSASGVSGLGAVSTVLTGAGLDAQAGEALGAGDINGDGVDDLVVGSSGTTGSGAWTGSALVLWGGAITTGSLASAPLTLSGGSDGAFAGSSVGVGDVDGDGQADVLVGARGLDAAYLHGGAGLPSTGSRAVTASDRTFPGAGPAARVGEGASLLGDVDGDGRAEVALRRDGTASTSWAIWRSATLPAASTVTSSPDYSLAGAVAVAAGSDADGDGRADLVVSWSTGESSVYLSTSLAPAGALTATSADLRVSGAGAGVAAPGDCTGDGRGDFLLGSEGSMGLWPAP